jgi:hypothetical protein
MPDKGFDLNARKLLTTAITANAEIIFLIK